MLLADIKAKKQLFPLNTEAEYYMCIVITLVYNTHMPDMHTLLQFIQGKPFLSRKQYSIDTPLVNLISKLLHL